MQSRPMNASYVNLQLWLFDFMVLNKETEMLGGKPTREGGRGGPRESTLNPYCKLSQIKSNTLATGG